MPDTTQTVVRSRYTGLRDIHLALVEQNTATAYKAGTPVKMPRAISGKVADKFSTEKIYSDDGVEDTSKSYEGTEVEFEVNNLAPQDRALVYDQFYSNGFLVKSAEDNAPEVALAFRARKMNGKYDFVWLYCGTFGEGNEDAFATEADKKTTQTASLKGQFYQRQKEDVLPDGKKRHLYEMRVDEANLLDEHTDAKEAIDAWFSEVQEFKAAG